MALISSSKMQKKKKNKDNPTNKELESIPSLIDTKYIKTRS